MARRTPSLKVVELTPARWPDIERLFGPRGACAGCWCMFWRLDRERFDEVKGETARRRFRALVEAGQAHGVLCYAPDGEPVGWASFERRTDLPRLDRAPSLRVDDAERVWSLPCFFVRAGWRGRGVATALLDGAVAALRRRRAHVLEAYPVLPIGGKVPAAFAYTGVPTLFERAGFRLVAARPRGKQRYRKRLR